MNTVLRPAVCLLAALALLTGVAYPLLVGTIGRFAFPEQAQGSLVRDLHGQVLGSTLIAQAFTGDAWFHPRPSAGAFATVASAASNLASTHPALHQRLQAQAGQLIGQGQGPVPLALLTTSGSGLDPDLPPDAALWQVKRIAVSRGLDAAVLDTWVRQQVRTPWVGPPVVNVLALNLALQQRWPLMPR
ncbi:potassium-transporting ATPase subunit KdpC [Pseudomonas entomophila]|uniref:potassium-transporting ATPase subunit KdpC n=1 Tax=Pseudomonas entomophila TaxID=312306 RepID=UPI0015E44531|nr:potassium-transporting ATPase subunit KdpC [Pseudomonas entomophila]MBA1189831.1 potassium-transporting ATPase subunit KdpC [Pseudomonas entomophila]